MIRIDNKEVSPEQFIKAFRYGINDSDKYFNDGGCYELFILIHTFWKDAVAWYDPIIGHVYTKIGDYWYDINGKHREIPEAAHIMDRREIRTAHRWSAGRLVQNFKDKDIEVDNDIAGG